MIVKDYKKFKIPYELNMEKYDSEDAFRQMIINLKLDPLTSDVYMMRQTICIDVWFAYDIKLIKYDHTIMGFLLRSYLTGKHKLKLPELSPKNTFSYQKALTHPYMAAVLPKCLIGFDSWENTVNWEKDNLGEVKIKRMSYVEFREHYRTLSIMYNNNF